MDMNLREILALAPLAVLALWIGLRPNDFLTRMQPTLTRATQAATARLDNEAATPVTATAQAEGPRASLRSSPSHSTAVPKLPAPITVPATEKLTRVR